MKLTLETERLILRPFREEDAEDMFYGWASDDEVTKYLTWNTHKSIDETKYILNLWVSEYEQPERLNFAVELKDGNKLIGGIDVVGYDEGIPVIGYNLAKKYWNKGYMTEACRCVLNYLFSQGYEEVKIDAKKRDCFIGQSRFDCLFGLIFFRDVFQVQVMYNCRENCRHKTARCHEYSGQKPMPSPVVCVKVFPAAVCLSNHGNFYIIHDAV